MVKYLGFLFLSVSFVICGLKVVSSQEVRPVSKIGQFSLRNDGEDLRKPIGSSISLPPEAKEKVEEVKKVEKKEVDVEEMYLKIPKEAPKAKEVKREEMVKGEERMGLKFAESKDDLPKGVAIAKVPSKPEVVSTMPEESKYFLQLSPEEEPLPKIKPGSVVKKPGVTPKLPSPKEAILPEEKVVVAKAKEVKEIIPPVTTLPEERVIEKSRFAFQRINPILRWGIIISGLFVLILILLVRYLWRQKELVSLAEIGEMPGGERPAKYKSLIEDVKELQTGYEGLEKMIENVEKRLNPLTSLKGVTIDEFTRDTSKEVFKPIELEIKELETTCQGLEKMVGEFDKRLAPLDALKGLSIKELAYQTSMESYKPLENEFKKMQIANERIINEFEEKMNNKIDSINKKNKGLEKTVSEIDNRLITVDSIISSSLSRGEGTVSKPMMKTEEIKLTTAKDKRNREILHNQIYKLSDEGLSIDEIAQQTKLGKGEVRLILGLRKK